MCKETNHNHDHDHDHQHEHNLNHAHHKHNKEPVRVELHRSVLAKNEELAEKNRRWFREHDIRVLNLISSPGTGKTLLLEKTVKAFNQKRKIAIIAGDQEMDFDTKRLQACGAQVIQINTQNLCHLDANMINHEIDHFITPDLQVLIIENVGNLVCPAAFDLGENEKIALLSVTEGEDKPGKYPLVFQEATAIIVTKIDLIPHLDWDRALCEKHIRKVNRVAPIFYLSAKTGEGLEAWFDYLSK